MSIVAKPVICYSYPAYKKVQTWVNNAVNRHGSAVEVGWSGTVCVDQNHYGNGTQRLYIADCWLWPDQVVSGGSITQGQGDHPKGSMEKLFTKLDELGVDLSKLNHYGHSHGSGNPFQSETDRSHVRDFFGFGNKYTLPYAQRPMCVAVTWNTKGETYGEVTIWTPVPYVIEGVPVQYELPPAGVELEALKELEASLIIEKFEESTVTFFPGHAPDGQLSKKAKKRLDKLFAGVDMPPDDLKDLIGKTFQHAGVVYTVDTNGNMYAAWKRDSGETMTKIVTDHWQSYVAARMREGRTS